MGNLHVREGTVNAEQYKYMLPSGWCLFQGKSWLFQKSHREEKKNSLSELQEFMNTQFLGWRTLRKCCLNKQRGKHEPCSKQKVNHISFCWLFSTENFSHHILFIFYSVPFFFKQLKLYIKYSDCWLNFQHHWHIISYQTSDEGRRLWCSNSSLLHSHWSLIIL